MRKLGDFGPLHPGKSTWNTNHGGLVQMIFLFKQVMTSGSSRSFSGAFFRNQTESTEDVPFQDAGLVIQDDMT